MQSFFQLTLTLGIVARTCTSRSTTETNYGVHPIFGPLTPSQEIKDFVASVFRKNIDSEEQDNLDATQPKDTEVTQDSGEKLRPKDMNLHANMGFDLYWPGGEWVNRKAEIERCNTTEEQCSPIFKNYGAVCAGNNDLNAHHTFDNMCDLYDTNCRDGTASLILQSQDPKDIRWLPVKRNSGVHIKISSSARIVFILTREKNINAMPSLAVRIRASSSHS